MFIINFQLVWEAEQVAKGWGDFIELPNIDLFHRMVSQLSESLSVFDVDGEGWVPMSHFKWEMMNH